MNTRFHLLVIRSNDPLKAISFYQSLGLIFNKHSHKGGVEHWISIDSGVVLEIYPLDKNHKETTDVRIGFTVDNIQESVTEALKCGGQVLTSIHSSEWGQRAVLKDPDGHRVEFIQENRNE